MMLPEFKTWLRGFTDAIEGPPTQEQWDTIKRKLEAVDDPPQAPPFYPKMIPIGDPLPVAPWIITTGTAPVEPPFITWNADTSETVVGNPTAKPIIPWSPNLSRFMEEEMAMRTSAGEPTCNNEEIFPFYSL